MSCLFKNNLQQPINYDCASVNAYNRTDSKTMIRFIPLMFAALAATTASAQDVVSLTPENYTDATAGHAVFIRFFAPWVSTVVGITVGVS